MTGRIHKYTYRLQTLSSVVLSPRGHQGFYRAAGDFTEEQIKAMNSLKQEDVIDDDANKKQDQHRVKIIYPFYQYGTYERYQPEETQYYIPGSSIKGALYLGNTEKDAIRLQVDDIRINYNDLSLYRLYKVQHLPKDNESDESKKSGEIKIFFQNLAVEMLDACKTYTGEMFSELTLEKICDLLEKAHNKNQRKLQLLIKKVDQILEQMKKEEDQKILQQMQKNIEDILLNKTNVEARKYILILGGYKGRLLAAPWETDNMEGAIYIDMNKVLPHGLVTVTLE